MTRTIRIWPRLWKTGYHVVSMGDLVRETGVSRGGIYSDFAGKQDLFHACLERYQETFMTPSFASVGADGAGIAAIGQILETVISAFEKSGRPSNGCLVANGFTAISEVCRNGSWLNVLLHEYQLPASVKRIRPLFVRVDIGTSERAKEREQLLLVAARYLKGLRLTSRFHTLVDVGVLWIQPILRATRVLIAPLNLLTSTSPTLNLKSSVNRRLPAFSAAVKFGKSFVWFLTLARSASYLESNDWMLLTN